MTSDKEYLGKDNIDKFDALFFKIRHFDTDEKGEETFKNCFIFVVWKIKI